jgi:nitrite reductase/ring-hydroxylating ferredoxin subunit
MAAAITLSAAEIGKISAGSSACIKVGGQSIIAFKAQDGSLLVAPNKCQHFGMAFAPDLEDAGMMKCTAHNAKLDPSTMSASLHPRLHLAPPHLTLSANLPGPCRVRQRRHLHDWHGHQD